MAVNYGSRVDLYVVTLFTLLYVEYAAGVVTSFIIIRGAKMTKNM